MGEHDWGKMMNREEALEKYVTNRIRLIGLAEEINLLNKEQRELKAIALAEVISTKTHKKHNISRRSDNQEVRYLDAIAQNGGKITSGELSELLSISYTTAYGALQRLVRMNLAHKRLEQREGKPPSAIFELVVKPDTSENRYGVHS